ncbi:hypothetical protein [Streptomyces sp. Tue6028]|uniref:hypothetical protein n=1 Tax=Streptomyces sp. Tue6028 TaxID=2036037 RepID=UPI0015CEE52E
MQHERDPLGRAQPVEDHEHREPDGLGELRFERGVAPVVRLADPVRKALPDELLPARGTGAQ